MKNNIGLLKGAVNLMESPHSQVLQRSNFMGGESGSGVKSPCLTQNNHSPRKMIVYAIFPTERCFMVGDT